MDKFRTIEFFLTTVKTQSFAETAKQFATDPSTVSKAIKRLEEQLGIQLFQRSTRQINITQAGAQYAETTRNLMSELTAYESALRDENNAAKGKLKINLPVSYGRIYMQPILSAFSKQYPDIQLDITFDDTYVDIIAQSYDVSIRSGNLTDNRVVAQKLSPIDFIICASPEYLKNNTLELKQDFFHLHSWVRFRFKQTGKLMGFINNSKAIEPKRQIIVDDGEAMAECCAAGLGLAQMPHFIAKPWVKNGSIVSIKGEEVFNLGGVYIIYPRRNYLPKRTRLFVDFVKEKIRGMGETPNNTWVPQ